MSIKLGVNIDHAATLRNARGENDPSLLEIAFETQKAGADLITMHLREDRRHIRDKDVFLVREHVKIPINFEMAPASEMVDIALKLSPKSVCLVPEKREEVTTEGGLDVAGNIKIIKPVIKKLTDAKIDVFLFTEPDPEAIKISRDLGANGVEIHTGAYARAFLNSDAKKFQLDRIISASQSAAQSGFEFHAGHGLNYHNIFDLLFLENLVEVNIGHAILSRALFSGLHCAISDMKSLLTGSHP